MSFYISQEDSYCEPVYTIGHAAHKLGIAVPTVRMYEHAGLILTYRTPSNRRLYSRRDLDRIKIIRDLIKIEHLNIQAIRRFAALIPCWNLTNCPKEVYQNCLAYSDITKPCWFLPESSCGKSKHDCRNCNVYISSPEVMQNPKSLLK